MNFADYLINDIKGDTKIKSITLGTYISCYSNTGADVVIYAPKPAKVKLLYKIYLKICYYG